MMNTIVWLRTSYWAGALADVLIGILTLVPGRMGETEYRYPMGLAATLMICWAGLLIWADRRPMERRGVLIPTFAVILVLTATGLYAVVSGIFPFARILPTTALGVVLIALLSFSYLKASRAESELC